MNTASQVEDETSTSSDADQELSSNKIVSGSKNHEGDSSEGDISAGEQPVCEGTAIRRRTFEATFLASSNKHKFSKATRNDILKFLETFIPKQNLPSCNYMFEKQLIEAMDIHYSQCELFVNCSNTSREGKCPKGSCARYDQRLNGHEIEMCYFIPSRTNFKEF